jgi:acyl-ACP thioesterase
MILPEKMPCGKKMVRYSDCDLNGHVSASNYAVAVCDFGCDEKQGYMKASDKLSG